jgi:hypothetical protein
MNSIWQKTQDFPKIDVQEFQLREKWNTGNSQDMTYRLKMDKSSHIYMIKYWHIFGDKLAYFRCHFRHVLVHYTVTIFMHWGYLLEKADRSWVRVVGSVFSSPGIVPNNMRRS